MAETAQSEVGETFAFFNEIGIISQLSRAFMEARLPDGLLLPHFSVCNHLLRVKDGQTPLALAKAFQVPKTTMTHTLSGLEKRNLVELKPNPKDGRSKCVWITDAGRTFRDATIQSLGPDFAVLAQSITPEELRQALPILTKVRQILDEARD